MLHSHQPRAYCPSGNPFSNLSSTLGIDSTLRDLPLYRISLDLADSSSKAADLFNTDPELPGILLTQDDAVMGLLSRYRFLDFLLRPKGCALFLDEPLSVLHSYIRLQPIVLSAETTILVAARVALRRPIELQGEPIWVQSEDGDRLVSAHELNVAHWQIRGIETQIRYERAQAAMLQNQKMAALGRLVDGVAHEILDPLSFIWGNLTHVSHYCQQLLQLADAYEQAVPEAAHVHTIEVIKHDIEYDYLRQDLPSTLSSIQSGAERLKHLATSLQNFCHIDEVYPKPADVHDLIESIVLLLKSRLTTKIQVVREYTSLPPIPCFAGQLSQVLMNTLSYCVDTLLEQAARCQVAADLEFSDSLGMGMAAMPPKICITTQLVSGAVINEAEGDRWVNITITDNGPGLSAAELQDLVATFSVPQRTERETDLATSYRIITAKHGGKFEVRSGNTARATNDRATNEQSASGTAFIIWLPLYSRSTST